MLVVTLFLTAARLWAATRSAERTARAQVYGVAATLPALVLIGLWLYRDDLAFEIILPGLAWRLFLLVYSLPSAVAAWQSDGVG